MPGPNAPYTALDSNQVLRQAFDESTDRLRVDANFTFEAGQAEVSINAVDDSIRIEDGSGNALAVNPDGSLNVNIIDGVQGNIVNVFNEITTIPSSVWTNIVNYTVPSGKTSIIQVGEVSGSNIGEYEILLNGQTIAKKYTNFGQNLNEEFNFVGQGISLSSGDMLSVRVRHFRPYVGNFNARLQLIEV